MTISLPTPLFNTVLMLGTLLLGSNAWAANPPAPGKSSTPMIKVVPLETASELKNRFRVDHMVSSMTLLIEREYGSAPVVIVLPDGSKWYANRHPETVKWVDGITGDIIHIESPPVGPWQLLGKVVLTSTIKKISKLEIEVQALPQPLFQGEQIKIIAQLMGDAERVRMPGLDYLVEWTAHFVSKHRAGDENFAVGDIIVGSYKDNGESLMKSLTMAFSPVISILSNHGENMILWLKHVITCLSAKCHFLLSCRHDRLMPK